MALQIIKKHWFTAVCILILCVYFAAVCAINFSGNPDWYITDMYADMNYAVAAWEGKSVFPDGWVFGNQLYAVATPVLAAFFYGICRDQTVAMALATTVMGFCVLWSFWYLLGAVFPSQRERLAGLVALMSLMLAAGDPVYSTNGWQLFFTMCSYYACYAVTVFLAFGCYLRSGNGFSRKSIALLVLTCLLSFGTGIQSLRQTAIMAAPLLAVALGHILYRLLRRKSVPLEGMVTAGAISVSNLCGVIFAKVAAPAQVEIFGSITLAQQINIQEEAGKSIQNAVSLFHSATKEDASALALLVFLLAAVLSVCFVVKKNTKAAGALLLLAFGVGGIFLVDVFSTMYVRSIYYFLLFPLVAFLAAALFSCGGKALRGVMAIMLIMGAISCYQEELLPIMEAEQKNDRYQETVEFLEEQGITTIFSGWNRGERIAIASGGSITAAFWDSPRKPFIPVKYLCDPSVFDVDPERCAYVFLYASEAETAVSKALERGVELTLLKHIPEEGVYIYTADVNLMTKK